MRQSEEAALLVNCTGPLVTSEPPVPAAAVKLSVVTAPAPLVKSMLSPSSSYLHSPDEVMSTTRSCRWTAERTSQLAGPGGPGGASGASGAGSQ